MCVIFHVLLRDCLFCLHSNDVTCPFFVRSMASAADALVEGDPLELGVNAIEYARAKKPSDCMQCRGGLSLLLSPSTQSATHRNRSWGCPCGQHSTLPVLRRPPNALDVPAVSHSLIVPKPCASCGVKQVTRISQLRGPVTFSPFAEVMCLSRLQDGTGWLMMPVTPFERRLARWSCNVFVPHSLLCAMQLLPDDKEAALKEGMVALEKLQVR